MDTEKLETESCEFHKLVETRSANFTLHVTPIIQQIAAYHVRDEYLIPKMNLTPEGKKTREDERDRVFTILLGQLKLILGLKDIV